MTFNEWILSKEGKQAIVDAKGSRAILARKAWDAAIKFNAFHQANPAKQGKSPVADKYVN